MVSKESSPAAEVHVAGPEGMSQGPAEAIHEGMPEGMTEPPRSLASRTEVFPHLPGVYLFKDGDGTVLYVGKARDLRKRVASYFRSTETVSAKTRVLVARASDLEYVVTSTEKEALLLESSLIKKHRPRYNVILRDDKSYPSLRIDLRDPFPRLEVVRRFQKDGALYFGPYPSGYAVRETLKMLNQMFPLRQCREKKLIPRERPCLNFSMGRCLGACAGKISREDYRKIVDEVVLFLQGKTDALQQQLRHRMEQAAEALHFEQAAFYRDRLQFIGSMLEKQHIVSDRFMNQDVIGIYQEPEGTELAVLFIRQGVIVGQKDFDLKESQGEPEEILTAFIQQYYVEGRYIPDEILIPSEIEAEEVLTEWLSELKGKRVRIWPVKRGDRRQLVELAEKNARERFASRRRMQQKNLGLLESLQRVLKTPRVPIRMACVDISNIQGQHAVGAIVVFDHGQPDKSSYRAYPIEGKSEPDDPAMMAETLERLFTQEPELTAGLDLLVLDGGKGQLNRIHRLLQERGMLEQLPLISIAKEREADLGDKGRGFYEKIYLPGRKNPRILSSFPELLHLLQRLRDESHRFAITNYQHLHRHDLLTSALDAIPGVGSKRRQLLLQEFGSMENLQKVSLEDLQRVPGISKNLAAGIYEVLKELAAAEEI
jgi:excinuclease ABC subunit C